MDANNNNDTWRSSLDQYSRLKIVLRIMDIIQRAMQLTRQESMGAVLKIASQFEQKVFHAATDQQDYVQTIARRLVSVEEKAHAAQGPGIQARLESPVLNQPSRRNIIKLIMDTLHRHMPPTRQESLGVLLKIASQFEEKIFHAATDQQDYLQTIAMRLLSVEKNQAAQCPGIQARLENPALDQHSRQKIILRIMDTLHSHMPPTRQESLGELLKIASEFEEKVFHAATDQQDYLQKIAITMLSFENKDQAAQGPAIDARLGNPAGVVKSLDPGPAMLMQNKQRAQYAMLTKKQQTVRNAVQLPGTVSGQVQTETTAASSISEPTVNQVQVVSGGRVTGQPKTN